MPFVYDGAAGQAAHIGVGLDCSNTRRTTYRRRSKAMPLLTSRPALPTKPCQMLGIQARALAGPRRSVTGTSRQPKNCRPSFCRHDLKQLFGLIALSSSCGKKNMPMPYSRSFPRVMPSSAATFWRKNLSLICVRMPTPSPVLPSASLPARCSRCSTICSASSMVWWLFAALDVHDRTDAAVVMLKLGAVQPGRGLALGKVFHAL